MIRNHNLSIDTAAARNQNNPSPEDFSDSEDDLSPSPIIDENIDFSLVYALHNFKATVEGQTTVDKGDSLNLLDDSNSYWWLVKVVKTEEVGYIPAENIETTTQEKVEIDETAEENSSNMNQEASTQVDENIDPYNLRETNNSTPTGQNGQQDKNNGLYRQQYGHPTEQQLGLPASNPTTPST
ncbi:15939_t:CDS:2, partial [Racocetra fulgida]